MAEEITDLTEDEEESESTEKPEKKAKPKKEKKPKEKKEKGEKKKREKPEKIPGEKKKSIMLPLLLILIPLLLIGCAVAAIIMNLFNARGMVNEVLSDPLFRFSVWLNPDYTSVEQELQAMVDERTEQVEQREQYADTRFEEIEQREEAANTREQLLDRRAAAIERREDELTQMYQMTVPLYRRDMTEQEIADMESLVRTFAQMSPEDAAEILIEMAEPRDVAAILYFMVERNAAAIMAVMERDYAAELTEILLYS